MYLCIAYVDLFGIGHELLDADFCQRGGIIQLRIWSERSDQRGPERSP